AGFALKQVLKAHFESESRQVVDLGTDSEAAVDYPDFAEAIGRAVLEGRAKRGISMCGSGVGAAIAANKPKAARAGLCHDTYSARQGVEHDDMNVLVLGARVIGPVLAQEIVEAFLKAEFTGEERHQRRLAKIAALEEKR